LGATLGAFAINAIFAVVVLMAFAGMHGYDSRLIWVVGSLAVAAPLVPIVLSFRRGVRSIRTAFFGACAIWAATLWLLIVVLDLYRYVPYSQIDWIVLPWIAYGPLVAILPAIAFARLVQTLLARISILPLTR
jgi:hypothetical protein